MQFKLGSNDWAKIKLSPDGAHLLGHWRQGDTICRILDGHALPPAVWLKGHQPEVFEAEALNRIGWLERSGRQVSVVLTDLQREERLGPFDDVSLGSDCFSTDGQHFTFAFEREGSWWVWVDGRELGPYTTARKPALYGRTLVFAAYRDPRYTMWIGDQEYDVHEGAFSPQVAADGGFAFGFTKGTDYFIQHGLTVLGPFGKRPNFQIGCSGRIAIEHPVAGKTCVELDGEIVWEVATGHVVSLEACFSPDAKRFGFAYQDGRYAGFYVDGVRRDALGYADGPWWSPDSKHLAWGADDDRRFIVIDGRESELASRIDFEEGASFRFAPDGRFCFIMRDDTSGKQLLCIGDEQFGPLNIECSARRSQWEQVAFSADGAHFAFMYRHDEERRTTVRRDQQTFGPFDVRVEFSMSSDGLLTIATFDPNSLEARLETHPPGA